MLQRFVSMMLFTGMMGQLGGCATAPKLTPDVSLLRPWEVDAPRPCEYPCVAHYSSGARELSFVASRHENVLSSDSFRTIRREFLLFQPQAVIIEGIPFADGISPQRYVDGVRQDLAAEFWRHGESSYTAMLAVNGGIAFAGGEPTDAQTAAFLREAGYSDRDMLGYFLVRQIPPWKRQNENRTVDLQAFLDEFQGIFEDEYGIDESARFSDAAAFMEWYREKNGSAFNFAKIDTDVTAPIDTSESIFTQRVSVVEARYRDELIVSIIARMLDRYGRVMVVYGAGHLYQQGRVLEKMLGRPTYRR